MFHAAVFAGGIFLSLKWGKWEKWRELLPTFYYWALFSCFYEYISYIGNGEFVYVYFLSKHDHFVSRKLSTGTGEKGMALSQVDFIVHNN